MSEHKTKETVKVIAAEQLAEGVFSAVLQYPNGLPGIVRPGQFVGVYPQNAAALLPRPISICGYDQEKETLRLVYRVVGKGTEEFSQLQAGDRVDVLGILGNGYDLSLLTGKRVLLLGGGIGAPPMLGLAEGLQKANREAGIEAPESLVTAAMGYRSGRCESDLFLSDEFQKVSRLIIATDDGTAGFHGNVVEAVKTGLQEAPETGYDAICACGPLPMLRGVKALAAELGIPAWISLEERMACGVGACLGCVARTTKVDGHSHVHNARVCTEGPVFAAEDVEI